RLPADYAVAIFISYLRAASRRDRVDGGLQPGRGSDLRDPSRIDAAVHLKETEVRSGQRVGPLCGHLGGRHGLCHLFLGGMRDLKGCVSLVAHILSSISFNSPTADLFSQNCKLTLFPLATCLGGMGQFSN